MTASIWRRLWPMCARQNLFCTASTPPACRVFCGNISPAAKLAYMFSWLNRFEGFGALIMRLVLGIIMVAHGYTKIIPSGALYTFGHMVAHMNLPIWLGYVAAFTEFFGGMLLIIGLLTRVAAFMTACDM